MSILETGEIDLIGTDISTGEVILTITDHLDWSDSGNHLLLLQDKLNTYIKFVEGGQINESFPSAQGKKLRIDIVAKYEYPSLGLDFLRRAENILKTIGIELSMRVFK